MDEKTISIPGWKIIRTIGKGSFGTVYEVEKEDEFGGGIRSALKVITIPESSSEIEAYRDDGYDDESMTKLFRSRVEDITSEFRLMSKLKGCRNIVSYEDHTIVQHENNPGYDVFIRMELLRPLPKYMDQGSGKSTFDDKTVQKLGVDICRALERCSQHGIIHRDIKPQNIFVNDDGDYKLGDFGVAKTSDHTTRATKTGTFGYMAPEVYWGKPYNASVDLYSLGLVMYWMLNERRGPFIPLPPAVPKPSQNAEALDRRMHGEPLPAPKHGSEALKRIVLKACAFDPKDRYESPTEMKRDLERLTVETNAEEPHAETMRADRPAAAGDDEETVGVYGGKPSTPEEPLVEEDEKTLGLFGTHQPKEPEPVPADDEATVSVKRTAPVKPAGKPVEPKKETKQVSPEPQQEEKPVKTETIEKKQPKKKSKLPVILSIAAAVVIAAVVLIAVLAGKGKTPSQPAQTAEQPTNTPTATATSTPTPTPTATIENTELPVETAAEATPVPEQGKTFNIYCWTDEFKTYFDKYYTVPEGVAVNWVIVSSNEYQQKLDDALSRQSTAAADDRIDLLLAEADYISKYVDSDYTMDISLIGFENADTQFAYTVEAATDRNGVCKGVAYASCPGVVIYRKSIAKDVLGTDIPEEVQETIDTWEKFDAVAVKAKEKGYYMTASFEDTFRPFFNNNELPLVDDENHLQLDDQVNAWIVQADRYVKNGYTLAANIWGTKKGKQMYRTGKTLCFFGPTWYYNNFMSEVQDPENGSVGDWGIVIGPQPYFWGGTWLLAAAGSDNQVMLREIFETFTKNESVCSKLVTDDNKFPNNAAVVDRLTDDPTYGNTTILDGQNDMGVLAAVANEVKWENRTQYDGLYKILFSQLETYYAGKTTKEHAIRKFYQEAKKMYPELIIPEK